MPRLSYDDAWRRLLAAYTDPTSFTNRITAGQIKELGVEPRLMTKYDARSSRSKILRERGLFVLPETNQSYLLLREDGYCDLSMAGIDDPEPYPAAFPVRLETLETTGSEMAHLDRLYLSGLIQHFVGTDRLWATIRGRRFSPRFTYNVGSLGPLCADRIQYEVDQGFETPDEIILFEAKATTPKDFLIRQLYFPYRVFKTLCHKPVRCIFLNYSSKEDVYSFFEYTFTEIDQYRSINLVNSRHYRLLLPLLLPQPEPTHIIERLLREAQRTPLPEQGWEIPQADDFGKILSLPLQIAEGFDSSETVAIAFDFAQRQSSYYRKACEQLGFVVCEKDNRYSLTDIGQEYLSLSPTERNDFALKALLSVPIIRATIEAALADHSNSISLDLILQLIREHSDITGDTVERRAKSVRSWIRWMQRTCGELRIGSKSVTVE